MRKNYIVPEAALFSACLEDVLTESGGTDLPTLWEDDSFQKYLPVLQQPHNALFAQQYFSRSNSRVRNDNRAIRTANPAGVYPALYCGADLHTALHIADRCLAAV